MTGQPTHAPVTRPLDVRTFLLGADSVAELGRRIRAAGEVEVENDVGVALPNAARRLLDEHVAAVAAPFLDLDLGAVLISGWQKHKELQAAARETVADPGLLRPVRLAGHSITSTWQPRIDVTLGGTTLGHVACTVAVELSVPAVSALVAAGRLTRLEVGPCMVTASLTVGTKTLASETAEFDPRLAVALGEGISLLGSSPDGAYRSARQVDTIGG